MTTRNRFARSRPLVSLGLGFLLLLAVAACDGGGEQAASQGQGQASAAADAPAPTGGQATLAGVTVTVPDSWQDLGPSGMRQAQFRLAAQAGDPEPAEVNVFYFGPQSGGGTEANLARWIGQMSLPDGGDAAAAAQRSTFEADGMAGHMVSIDGTYQAGSMRPMGGDPAAPKPGYRLVGVVLEGPQGSLFFKLTGPEATARVMEESLLEMVRGARQAG
jgi:hypothetical protein